MARGELGQLMAQSQTKHGAVSAKEMVVLAALLAGLTVTLLLTLALLTAAAT